MRWQTATMIFVGWCLVAFGQPAWCWWLGLLASVGGYALLWHVLLDIESGKKRFWTATAWFTAVQAVQLSWLLAHPFYYIYAVHLLLSLVIGLQFGVMGYCITRERIRNVFAIVGLAGLWTLLEWTRIFWVSGFPWNPVGLALSGHDIPMQLASVLGVYGLSFWVVITNLFMLRWWEAGFSHLSGIVFAVVAVVPYLFGSVQLALQKDNQPTLKVLIVDSHFPCEELGSCDFFSCAQQEWWQLLQALSVHQGKPCDLIVFPEGVVPFGADSTIYRYDRVAMAFRETLGVAADKMPLPMPPFAASAMVDAERSWRVSNSYWVQTIANFFGAEVVVGLEAIRRDGDGVRRPYNAALWFCPQGNPGALRHDWYGKRVLLPMGEYIPFEWLKSLAAHYGVTDSFHKGEEAKVFHGEKAYIGLSICYEDTLGYLTRENCHLGATLLVNLTNDGWFPDSRLAHQHFDHSRLRAVENGIPMVRACNDGISGAVDGRGRVLAATTASYMPATYSCHVIEAAVPMTRYPTLFSLWGDWTIVAIACAALLMGIKPMVRWPGQKHH